MARPFIQCPPNAAGQRGAVLIVALVFLLLLTLIGISSMQNATLQEKMAGSVATRNTTLQLAESALRVGEKAVAAANFNQAVCASTAACKPPIDTSTVAAPGNGQNSVVWKGTLADGLYAIQYLGITGTAPVNFDAAEGSSVMLYRITAVGMNPNNTAVRTVLESIYAKKP
ncbi:pilus assembly PilX family protein [Pseudomonas sp. KNUC1026]|uniref:pilus assembly PilX family protein n=1 Tax=Pseudomonas sp. KNUC1026 TaxID=2893890 RepID=UPI001F1DD459|nr:PilX N-terminal domain-containing pilus assembly protein [Pseudomonas sp. KNUC1026]UFH48798.1 pilus assembly protein PilX [Pseudomonas sp. KNUC1026]